MAKLEILNRSRAPSSKQFRHLSREFFARDTHDVARELLGKLLVRRWRNKMLAGRIVEVESYVGQNDAACHAARGRTPRTEVMFGEAGHAYVYLIYGMYYCLNIVTEKPGFPAAVLIRALEPTLLGDKSLLSTDGPGKLTRVFHITRTLNTEDMAASQRLYVADDGYEVTNGDITTTPRVGVDYAGKDALLPWRYYISRSLFVSRR